ncbi:MAG: hypothetical protein AAFX87_29345 [Bacteroidota bacterium]
MKAIKRLILITAITTFFNPLSAQIYKYKGKLVKTNGDTLDVIIKSGYKYENQSLVTYKLHDVEGAEFVTLNPSQVKLYSHNYGSYHSTTLNSKRIFLKTNLIGYISLYETVTESGEIQYFLKTGDEQYTYVPKENTKQFLKNYFSDCGGLENVIQKATYTRFRLSNVVSAYNACVMPSEFVEVKYKPEKGVVLNLIGGFGYDNYNIRIKPDRELSTTINAGNSYPYAGLDLSVVSERKVTTGIMLTFKGYNFDIDFLDAYPEDFLEDDTQKNYDVFATRIATYFSLPLSQKHNLNLRVGLSLDLLTFTESEFSDVLVLANERIQLIGVNVGADYRISNKVGLQLESFYGSGREIFVFQDNTSSYGLSAGIRYKLN